MIKFLLLLYQKFLSPALPRSCRFYPSCSQYAVEAIDRFGFCSIFMVLKRIFSCHPFSPGGYDPVPELSTKAQISKSKCLNFIF